MIGGPIQRRDGTGRGTYRSLSHSQGGWLKEQSTHTGTPEYRLARGAGEVDDEQPDATWWDSGA